ncbi:MAG: N-6 DNA methylase, partial [Acidimicrobiales bacterium]|nr:N-6 DNA methylase [Acidimicrobiales bacterium]
RCVRGVDVDPAAVAATRAGLAAWAGVAADSLDGIRCGDALADADPEPVDLVVGNPPFQSQLAAATARTTDEAERLRLRLGDAVVRYVDTAAVFLVDAVARLRPDGVAALVAPLSILSAGDAAPIRQALTEAADLAGLWVATEPVFAADVPTCAPVLIRRSAIRRPEVARWRGATFEDRPAAPAPDPASTTWAPLLADLLAVPPVVLTGSSEAGRVVGDLGRATAGFRDQYYGLRGAVVEAAGPHDERPRLITSGLIDPAACRWGRAPVRFDRRPWTAPVVDLDWLAAEDPAVAAWGEALLVPKLVVATQTRVIEAAVDRTGTWWPSVPTIAVTAPPEALDHLLAVLLAPPVSAWAFGEAAGAALSSDALRLRASQIAAIPLPPPGAAWDAAATILADTAHSADADAADAAANSAVGDVASISRDLLVEVGALMCEAYGVGEDVLRWWMDRLPVRG